MGKRFATSYAGNSHDRSRRSDELVSKTVNRLKVSKRGEAAVSKFSMRMALGEARGGDDMGELIAFMSPAVALQLGKAPAPALPGVFQGFCPLLGPYRRVRRRCRLLGPPRLWPADRRGCAG
jgi:hypothetical protein